MNKILSVFLIILLSLSFSACARGDMPTAPDTLRGAESGANGSANTIFPSGALNEMK